MSGTPIRGGSAAHLERGAERIGHRPAGARGCGGRRILELDQVVTVRDGRHRDIERPVGQPRPGDEGTGIRLDVMWVPPGAMWCRKQVPARGEMPVRCRAEQPPAFQFHHSVAGEPGCRQGHNLARPGMRWAGGQRGRAGVAAKRIYGFRRVGAAQRTHGPTSHRAGSSDYRQNCRPDRDGAVPHNVQTVADPGTGS